MTTLFDLPEDKREPELVAIRAGAGAGKTTRITNRYVNHVIHDGLSPLEIVAVTFTDAAALELRSRIREKLGEALGQDDDRLAELEAARISTFHSLAAAICRQHPVEAEVPSDFALLDEVQGALWLMDKLDDALDTLPERLYSRVPFSRMRSAIRALMSDPISAAEALQKKYRDWKQELAELQRSACTDLITSEAWATGKALLLTVRGAEGDILEPYRVTIVDGCREFELGDNLTGALKKILSAKLTGGKQTNWPVPVSEVKAAIKGVRELADAALKEGLVTMKRGAEDAQMLRKVRALKQAYAIVQIELSRVKRQERLLDYSDLEVHAIKALAHNHVRKFYHARWRAFVVDEYQDTNSVQDEILKRLRTVDTRRAIVGDANQSIYGFRRADPGLIDEAARQIIDDGGSMESLDTNYRTNRSLLVDMNSMFQTLFEGGKQPFVPQAGVRDAPTGNQNIGSCLRVFQVALAEGSRPPRAPQLRVEALNISKLLTQMHGSGTLVFDKQKRVHRAMEWGDVAIIARTWSSLDPYSDALVSLGISHVHMGGGNLMDTREARDGFVLLRFLADPADDLALAALLKSPFFTVSDLHLYQLRLASSTSLLNSLENAASTNTAMNRRFSLLSRLLLERQSASPSRLLHLADCETGLSAILLGLPSGERRLADWRGFCALVTEIEKTSFDAFSVARVLRRLDMARSDRTANVQAPRPALEAGNAISLMTVHRSKGLEWPIVVIADLARGARRDDSFIVFDPKYGVALKSDGVEAAEQPMLFRFLRHRTAVREQEEEKRLLYVAATRARDTLLLASTKPGARAAFTVLEPGLKSAGIDTEYWNFSDQDAQFPLPMAVQAKITQPIECIGLINSASPKQIPATSLVTYMRCPKQFEYQVVIGHPGIGDGEAVYDLQPESVIADPVLRTEGNFNLAQSVPREYRGRFGTLVHKAIQYDLHESRRLQRYDRALQLDIVKAACLTAETFRNNKIYSPYNLESGEIEVPIQYKVGDITLSGRIDMLGSNFVLDFKTGSRSNQYEHLLQLWVYAQSRAREVAVVCYFDGLPPRVVVGSEMSHIRAIVNSLVERIKQSDFVATPSLKKCEVCPYKLICPDSVAPAASVTTEAETIADSP